MGNTLIWSGETPPGRGMGPSSTHHSEHLHLARVGDAMAGARLEEARQGLERGSHAKEGEAPAPGLENLALVAHPAHRERPALHVLHAKDCCV